MRHNLLRMRANPSELSFETLLSHFGEDEKLKGAVVPPLFLNSTFVFQESNDLFKCFSDADNAEPYHYSRIGNPTVHLAEQKIAALEGAEACKLTGSGMGAIAQAILSTVKSGSHVIAVETGYGPVRRFVSEYLTKFGVTATLVDGGDTQEIFDAMRPETTCLYLEAPSSIVFRMQDIPAITAECKKRGIVTVFDNTYNTPIHCNPLAQGVDIVCHSATKYMGGHSDVTAGAICTTKERVHGLTHNEVDLLGSILHPFSAWLVTRGLRTLSVRIKRHESTANKVAAWLENQPEVKQVLHVGLDSHPQRDLVKKVLRGTGGLFSFVPECQDLEKVKVFVDKLQFFGCGVSWGGFESLVIPTLVTAKGFDQTWIVRLYCGLEDPDELITDLKQALTAFN